MNKLFEVKPVDIDFYQQKIRNFMPDKIIDSHTHVWLDSLVDYEDDQADRIQSWPLKVSISCSSMVIPFSIIGFWKNTFRTAKWVQF